ncbi:MAG: hypothetical protein LBT15_05565 [Synergistaceae bacterium]|nr:hypothetical protein [Synergistaceae bacterium]
MSKRMRPSLKDYLKTGKVSLEPVDPAASPSASSTPPETPVAEKVEKTKKASGTKRGKNVSAVSSGSLSGDAPSPIGAMFLGMLSEADRGTWDPILRAGTEIASLPADFVALREEFRTADRSRFTFYILDRPGTGLRPLRTSVQIREPMTLLVRWDEMGMLTLFGLDSSAPPSTNR